jgi:Ca-activated chloride channel family protein
LLAVLPLVAVVALPRREGVSVGTLTPARRLAPTWRVRLEPALGALRIASIALLIIALARPQRGEAATETRGEGIDIVLAFDVSSSMTEPFGQNRTRIQAAKQVLRDFVDARQSDRVGLVAFQGSSIALSPLTIDYEALSRAVEDADRLQLADGTAIGTALGDSVNALRGSTAASRIVILLTDGENNAGTLEPLAAARIAERLGVRVYTVGVVGTGNPLRPSRVNVDEESLRSIADVTGGTYSRAEDEDALGDVYQRIDELETSRFVGRTFTRFDEIAPLLLAAAAAALACEIALRHTVLRRLA